MSMSAREMALMPFSNLAAAFSPDGRANLSHGKVGIGIGLAFLVLNLASFTGNMLYILQPDGTYAFQCSNTPDWWIHLLGSFIIACVFAAMEWVMWAFLWTKGWKTYVVVDEQMFGKTNKNFLLVFGVFVVLIAFGAVVRLDALTSFAFYHQFFHGTEYGDQIGWIIAGAQGPGACAFYTLGNKAIQTAKTHEGTYGQTEERMWAGQNTEQQLEDMYARAQQPNVGQPDMRAFHGNSEAQKIAEFAATRQPVVNGPGDISTAATRRFAAAPANDVSGKRTRLIQFDEDDMV